jgi:AcrR family transcriptional regulator
MLVVIVKDSRQKMVWATLELLRERGYAGTSFGDIIERSGAPRGSIYHHFPGGKQELVREAITLYAEGIRRRLAAAGGSIDITRALVDAVRDTLRASDFTAGCAVAGLVLDLTPNLAPGDRALLDLSAEAFGTWRRALATAMVADGATEAQARRLAVLVVSATEGAFILARAERDVAPIVDVGHELEAHLRATLPGPQDPNDRSLGS